MRVVFFGSYSTRPEYPRGNNLIRGLRASGVEVLECRYSMAESFAARERSVVTFRGALWYAGGFLVSSVALSWRFLACRHADAVVVAYPAFFHLHLVRLLRLVVNRRMLIIHDAFIPLHDTLVHDRKLLRAGGVRARLVRTLEASFFRVADLNLVDTEEHGRYFSEEYGVPLDRFLRVPVGPTFPAHETATPKTADSEEFSVLYVGTYIPLHGVDVIIRAARELADEPGIRFRLVGTGQQRDEMEDLARRLNPGNVFFEEPAPADELGALIRSCDMALGIFGETAKSSRVIPIKVFDACAAGVPFITADTPAVREFFRHGENAWLVPAGDPAALAEAVRLLRKDAELRNRIGAGAHETAHRELTAEIGGRTLMEAISGCNARPHGRVHLSRP